MKRSASEYFPKSYATSRAKFKSLVMQIPKPCEIGYWKIDSAKDPDLTVDYVWLPPLQSPEKLLVLISGIHGSESYAGAAIQTLFLEEILPGLNRDHLGVFIVHAMNPYGFKYHQRTTENKVNLNRNFSLSGELFRMKTPESQRLNELFLPREPLTGLRSRLLDTLCVTTDGKRFFGDIPLDDFIKAISPGQFEREDDLEYGGKKAEPQTLALIKKMQDLMPAFKDVIALDLHTGLGHKGRLHLLTDGEGKSLDPKLFAEIFKHDEDKDVYEFSPAEAEGFYPVHGATNAMFRDLAKEDQRVCAVTLEFGTLGHNHEQQITDLNQLLISAQGQHYGYANEALKREVEARDFERSYPDNDSWREDVLRAAKGLLERIVFRLEER